MATRGNSLAVQSGLGRRRLLSCRPPNSDGHSRSFKCQRFTKVIGWTAIWLSLCLAPFQIAQCGQYALVVGINSYERGQLLPKLRYAADDAIELAKLLESSGYTVSLLTQGGGDDAQKPDEALIRFELRQMLANAQDDDDTVIVALIGHGVQFPENTGESGARRGYFCPADARIAKVKSVNDIGFSNHLIDLSDVYAQLERSTAGAKLLVLDISRLNPLQRSNRQSAFSLTRPKLSAPTEGVAALISCLENQSSIEDSQLKHGVFFDQLLAGLKGEADLSTAGQPADGRITLDELYTFTANRTRDFVQAKYNGREQQPELAGGFRVPNPLIAALPLLANRQAGQPLTAQQMAAQQQAAQQAAQQPSSGRSGSGSSGGGQFQISSAQQPPRSNSGSQLGLSSDSPPADFTNGLGADMLLIEAGSFTMGSPTTEANRGGDEGPVGVRLTTDFWIGKHEVTQGEYTELTGASPWMGQSGVLVDPSAPATFVSWDDATAFCAALTTMEQAAGRLPPEFLYDLPTEAQWEYTCRGGTQTAYYFGNPVTPPMPPVLPNHAWYNTNAGSVTGQKFAHLVGLKSANEFELFDVHGNVREWCRDKYTPTLPGGSDPFTSDSGTFRTVRGGSWKSPAPSCRAAARNSKNPITSDNATGFRVCIHSTSTP